MAKLTPAQIAGVAVDAGFPIGAATVPVMVAIALAESGGVTDAKSRTSTASGLWQEIAANWHGGNPMDPLQNGKMAVATFKSQGLGAWVTWSSGAYLVHMPLASAASKAPDHSYPGGPGGTSGPPPATGEVTNAQTEIVGGQSIAGSLAAITNPKTWLRVFMFLAGIGLLISGFLSVSGIDKTVVQFAKGAAKDALGAAVL